MVDSVLWRQLTQTDYNSIHGLAAPSGSGGGARHIALGVSTPRFPIDQFLGAGAESTLTVDARSDGYGTGELRFTSIPGRRGGEWIIPDQHTNRHPAWSIAAGLPSSYDPTNRPVILVFRIGNYFHARLSDSNRLSSLRSELSGGSITKGIAPVTQTLLSAFNIQPTTFLNAFEEYLSDEPSIAFDPSNVEDGRRSLFGNITQRQGQGPFRDLLLTAYSNCCAMTGINISWVLEAAHIVPYRGAATSVLPNGLLLRADVHTLFDLGLISIEPRMRSIVVSTLIRSSCYGALHDQPLRKPNPITAQPSTEALEHHYIRFVK